MKYTSSLYLRFFSTFKAIIFFLLVALLIYFHFSEIIVLLVPTAIYLIWSALYENEEYEITNEHLIVKKGNTTTQISFKQIKEATFETVGYWMPRTPMRYHSLKLKYDSKSIELRFGDEESGQQFFDRIKKDSKLKDI